MVSEDEATALVPGVADETTDAPLGAPEEELTRMSSSETAPGTGFVSAPVRALSAAAEAGAADEDACADERGKVPERTEPTARNCTSCGPADDDVHCTVTALRHNVMGREGVSLVQHTMTFTAL